MSGSSPLQDEKGQSVKQGINALIFPIPVVGVGLL